MKIRLVGGHSHGRQLDWDIKASGDMIQVPYREDGNSTDPLDTEFGVEAYTIRKFVHKTQPDRFNVRAHLWYVAVLSTMTDAIAEGYSHMIRNDLPHDSRLIASTPAEQAMWDDQHRNDTKDN